MIRDLKINNPHVSEARCGGKESVSISAVERVGDFGENKLAILPSPTPLPTTSH